MARGLCIPRLLPHAAASLHDTHYFRWVRGIKRAPQGGQAVHDVLPLALACVLASCDHLPVYTHSRSSPSLRLALASAHTHARCWQKTGLQGNFAQDFVTTWEGKAKPVAATWAAVQDQWLTAIADFEGEGCPGLNVCGCSIRRALQHSAPVWPSLHESGP